MSLETSSASSRNARIGTVLFLIYLAFYVGFIALSATAQEAMGAPLPWLGGVNVAIAYGMGLILLALVLASIYLFSARAEPAGASERSGS